MLDGLRTAFRSLRGSRSVTTPALIVLALAIGASTALFSVVDAVVLRRLPFDQQDRLVAIGERQSETRRTPGETAALSLVAPQNYLDWVEQQQVFESVAAIASGWLTLHQAGGQPESLVPQYVTPRFIDVLRAHPAVGRTFTADDQASGRDRVAVLSDGLWQRVFGADPQIVGKTITLDNLTGNRGAYEVVGVMRAGFAYPVGVSRPTDVWLPFVVPAEQRVRSTTSRINYLQVIGRLKTGVSLEQAQAQLDQIAASIERAHPQWNKGNLIGVRPLVDHIVGAGTKAWMLMLLGAVGIVLVIACANVTNLLLVHATSRERNLGIRVALGATRWRLIRELLVESLLLSAAATVCGLLIALWGVHILKGAMPDNVPRVTTIAVNLRVLAATASLALITAVLCGLIPALQVSRPNLAGALKDGARTTVARGRQRLRNALVVSEIALAVWLLVGAALFIGSFMAVMRIDPGFNSGHVLTAQVSPPLESSSQPRDWTNELEQLTEGIAEAPGVVHAAIVGGNVPMLGGFNSRSLTIPSRGLDLTAGEMIAMSTVSADYHRALRIPLRRGRLFERSDQRDGPQVAIINESAARKYFPDEDAIGREIGLDRLRTVVGVVGDIRQTSLEVDPRPESYIPLTQGRIFGGSLVIRTGPDAYTVLNGVKAATFAVLPSVPLRNVITMEELIGSRVAQRRLTMLLIGLFGVLGLLISAVGIYGVMAYHVAQKTREIGVRVALGATPPQILRMVGTNAAALVVAGLLIGISGAWYLRATAQAFLFRVEPTDVRAFAAAVLLLAGAAAAASVIPARRAARVDPIVALRAE
jgi:putative ABC transport system permease protein